jgi:hypothetical protein
MTLDLLARSVLAVPLDEDDLLIFAKSRDSPDDRLDVSPLVAAGHYDRRGNGSRNGLGYRARDQIVAQAQAADQRQRAEVPVDDRT